MLGISLLRSPIYPDPYADEGDHEFVYAIYPHRGDWRNGTVRAAKELHCPLRFSSGRPDAIHSSLLRLSGGVLELACMKRAEDSDDVLLRLSEPHGDRGHTVLESMVRIERAAIVNILEEQLRELPCQSASRER
jgi:alpha-mannosidase